MRDKGSFRLLQVVIKVLNICGVLIFSAIYRSFDVRDLSVVHFQISFESVVGLR